MRCFPLRRLWRPFCPSAKSTNGHNVTHETSGKQFPLPARERLGCYMGFNRTKVSILSPHRKNPYAIALRGCGSHNSAIPLAHQLTAYTGHRFGFSQSTSNKLQDSQNHPTCKHRYSKEMLMPLGSFLAKLTSRLSPRPGSFLKVAADMRCD